MHAAELAVTNLGVIDELAVVLGPGLTAVTGETGAGKTMLVESIELLVGGRADPILVRPGAAEATVEGRFVVADDEIVLARVVPRDGRSRAYVNGRLAPASALAEHGAGLVDLHGQHAHQSLLAASSQRAALDAFGGDRPGARCWRRGPRCAGWTRRSPRSAATSGSGPARSTCCGSRSPSWPPPASTIPTRTAGSSGGGRAGRCAAHRDAAAEAAAGLSVGGAGGRGRGPGGLGAERPGPVRRADGAARGSWPPSWPTWPARSGPPARRSPTTPSGWRPCVNGASACGSCAASTATRSPTSSPTTRMRPSD